MQSVKNPHDKYFQSSMSNILVAKDFFAAHLPKEFRKAVDLDTIKVEKASYIDMVKLSIHMIKISFLFFQMKNKLNLQKQSLSAV